MDQAIAGGTAFVTQSMSDGVEDAKRSGRIPVELHALALGVLVRAQNVVADLRVRDLEVLMTRQIRRSGGDDHIHRDVGQGELLGDIDDPVQVRRIPLADCRIGVHMQSRVAQILDALQGPRKHPRTLCEPLVDRRVGACQAHLRRGKSSLDQAQRHTSDHCIESHW